MIHKEYYINHYKSGQSPEDTLQRVMLRCRLLLVLCCCLGNRASHPETNCRDDAGISCQPHADAAFASKEHRDDPDTAWRSRCNIKRIQWPRAQAMLPLPDEPYIVGVPRNWNTRIRRSLEHDVLLGSMGNVTCTPSQAGSKRIGTFEMTLAQYLQEWLPKPISKNAEDNRYVFGEFGENWAPLRESYKLPPCQVCTPAAAAITIGLGGSFSGAPWHFHNAAFVEVFHGSKHFAFLPPGDPAIEDIETDMQFNASMSQYHWHLERRPDMEVSGQLRNLQECLIQSGELLYFPDGWHHGVVNFGKYTAFVSSFINRDLLKQAAPTTLRLALS